MRILLPQYARMENSGLFTTAGADILGTIGFGAASKCRGVEDDDPSRSTSPSSIAKSFLLSLAIYLLSYSWWCRVRCAGDGSRELRGLAFCHCDPPVLLAPSDRCTPMKVVVVEAVLY